MKFFNELKVNVGLNKIFLCFFYKDWLLQKPKAILLTYLMLLFKVLEAYFELNIWALVILSFLLRIIKLLFNFSGFKPSQVLDSTAFNRLLLFTFYSSFSDLRLILDEKPYLFFNENALWLFASNFKDQSFLFSIKF